MRKSVFGLIILCSVILGITSCQKELSYEAPVLPSQRDSLTGNWKFLSLDVKSAVTISTPGIPFAPTTDVITDFISKNNLGTLKIDSFNLDLTDLSYSIDTIAKINTYFAGTLLSSEQEDVVYDSSPYTTVSEYRLIGTDSIYFPNADFINLPDNLLFVSQPISGMKYKFEGGKLNFRTSVDINQTDSSSGINLNFKARIQLLATFEKQ